MTEENNKPDSFVQVVFEEYGSAIFEATIGDNVTPLQLYALSKYLDMIATRTLNRSFDLHDERRVAQSIAVPESADKIQIAR